MTTAWRSQRLPRSGRIAVITVIVVALVAHGIVDVTVGDPTPSSYADVGMLAAFAAFAWRPPLAAIGLLIGSIAGLLLGIGGPYMLALGVAAGLVIYTCRRWFAVTFCGIAAVLTGATEIVHQGIASGGSLGVLAVGLASGMVGWGLRRGHDREQQLHAREQQLTDDVARLETEAAQAVGAERNRIADELHNIIVHDITIVVMHSRALKLIDDPEERERSIRGISTAASQAMTDIRRMLNVVRDDTPPVEGADSVEVESVLNRIQQVASELTALGARVQIVVPESLAVSTSIEATLWHLVNECATNIMKHMPNTPEVHLHLTTTPNDAMLRVWNADAPARSDIPEVDSGYGLQRMADRVSLLDGSLTYGKSSNGGWVVEATLPRA